MPVLDDYKKETFAQACAMGLSCIDAYVKAGFKRNSGNATNYRKRPEISSRIDEIIVEMQRNSGQELTTYLIENKITQAYVIKQILDCATKAKHDKKFTVALEAFKLVGAEVFGMFKDRKHIIDATPLHTTPSTTINIENLNQALEGLTSQTKNRIEREDSSFLDFGRSQLAIESIPDPDPSRVR